MAVLLDNPVRSYPWGSSTVLAELLGRPASGEPEAELWIGAHPDSPSTVRSDGRTLDRYVADAPIAMLGPAVAARFGPRLPFLLKVLAVERPLSIQLHPTIVQAVEGYAREDAAGVPTDSTKRSYRDRGHKPELLVALSDFEALVGFADPTSTAELLASCEHPELSGAASTLLVDDGIRAVAHRWLTLPEGAVADVIAALGDEAPARRAQPRWELVDWLRRMYSTDRGVLLALLMRPLRLRPGQAVFVPAGVLHCYLSGVAVEAQVSTDNTVRAGLTAKHVDTGEVLRTLRAEPGGGVAVEPRRVGPERVYTAPAEVDELRVSTMDLTSEGAPVRGAAPRLLLVTDGEAWVSWGGSADGPGSSVTVRRGQAAFVPASDRDIRVGGQGVAFLLTTALDGAR